jgi:hypothetical protein
MRGRRRCGAAADAKSPDDTSPPGDTKRRTTRIRQRTSARVVSYRRVLMSGLVGPAGPAGRAASAAI